jgi:hypothetical protein
VKTVYHYRTVPQIRHVTRYRDIYRTHYVTYVNRRVSATKVQPIKRVHVVTRIHNRTVVRSAKASTVHNRGTTYAFCNNCRPGFREIWNALF